MSEITVYTAKKIHTMCEPSPIATAVAIKDGAIVEVGSIETLKPWLQGKPHTIDTRFEDDIIFPGFIDPHLHPSMGAVLLPMKFITAFPWTLPGEKVEATRGEGEYRARLSSLLEMEDGDAPFFTWGYHRLWHGKITRSILDELAGDRPVIVWQRSFHEVIVNTAALKWMEIQENEVAEHPQIDVTTGRFYETGLIIAIAKMTPFLFAPEWYGSGLQRLKQLVHMGGHTTVADMAYGIFNETLEWSYATSVLDQPDVPFRVQMVPKAFPGTELIGDIKGMVEDREKLLEKSTDRLLFKKHVKLFTDGAFFGELMQLMEPGYIDGHKGEWLMAPEQFEAAARAYWHAGYQIHVHCTGDMGLELAVDVLEKLQTERPRFNHRYTIEHFSVSTPEQVQRLAILGGVISANVYYVHELGEAYWQESIGYERASQMVRLGTVAREGIPFALHSDFTMAPASPLNSACVAINRLSESGKILCPNERITVHQAMKSITIDAAYILGMENEIGSIRAGKKADLVVLGADPYEVHKETIKDIPVLATIFEGTPHEVPQT